MSPIQQGLALLAAVSTFIVVVEMLRRGRLRERHAAWWLGAGLLAIVVSAFPNILTWSAALFGFEVPINLVFFFSLFILFLVALQHSSELTKLEEQNRALVERVIVLELRVEAIEAEQDQAQKR